MWRSPASRSPGEAGAPPASLATLARPGGPAGRCHAHRRGSGGTDPGPGAPALAFLLLHAILAIAFGAFCLIADGLSAIPLLHGPDRRLRVSLPDALPFSVVAFSTSGPAVGHGDIRRHDDGIRVLASIQVVTGQSLLLLGSAGVMRSRRPAGAGGDSPGHGPAG